MQSARCGFRHRAREGRLGSIGFGAIGLALLAALVGCATDEGHLTLASTRPVSIDARDLRDLDFEKLPVLRDIEGSHTAVTSVLFIPTFTGPHLELAVEDALELGHGDLLTRARVRTTKWWFLVGVETLTVRGNVVDLPEAQ
jgi:hypothetical protein